MPELIDVVPGSPEWLAARRAGVTATDIVTILGLNAWDSAYSVFWRKVGQVPEVPDSDRFRLGRELESYAAERWREEQPAELTIGPSALFQHSQRTWQLATIDRRLDGGVLELKTSATKDEWGQGEVFDEFGLLVHDDQVPPRVRAQVLWQMDVMDVAAGHVGVVFLPSGAFRSYTIEHRHEPWDNADGSQGFGPCPACVDQGLMLKAGEEFMARLRLELPPPDPDSSAATLAAVRARFTRQPDKTADIDPKLWAQYADWKDELVQTTATVRKWEIQVREQAGEAQVLCVDGQPVARRVVSDAKVKAHTRHVDYLRRITPKEDGDA